jgi:hypothetical protein
MTDNDQAMLGRASQDEREARLAAGADDLAGRARASILQHPRFLLWVSVTLMTLGLAFILLGWAGASRSIVIEEQVPYLISGGLLGLALALIGAVTLFAQWLTTLIREEREREAARARDHRELMEALRSLTDATRQENGNGSSRSARSERAVRRTTRR